MCAAFRKARQDFLKDMEKRLTSGKMGGSACARAISDFHDEMMRFLFSYALHILHPRPNPTKGEDIALIATGGYGRRALAPHSDLDLLFLLPYKATAWSESLVESILYMLWDIGLKVGHAVRRKEEAIAMAKKDITICSALLDARFLNGNEDLFQALQTDFRKQTQSRRAQRHFVEAKLLERDLRHRASGHSRYMVEPNIKNGKGGLRDLQTLLWIADYNYGLAKNSDIVKAKLLSQSQFQRFQSCEDMLWKVRAHLHFLKGQAEEHLAFGVQKDVARAFGMDNVEGFMKKYFLTTKYVGDLTRIVCAVLEEQQKKKIPLLGRLKSVLKQEDRTIRKKGFAIEGGRLTVKRKGLFEKAPLALMHLFSLSAKMGILIHPHALALAQGAGAGAAQKLRQNKRAGHLFLEILSSPAPEEALRAMNETGFLGRFIPDFGRIVALMQFNMYHHYTADEHLLRAVGEMSRMARGSLKKDFPPAAQLMAKIVAKEDLRAILFMAIFLHDIAKGGKEDHSEAGARVAKRLSKRMGLDGEATETIVWLVKNHLLMSDVAQRRDLSDPQIVGDFVNHVGDQKKLDLLFLLTIADIRAVGPGTWNGWKAELLKTLYERATKRLEGTPAAPRPQAVRAKKENLLKIRQKISEEFMKAHPPHYWTMLETETHLRHADLYEEFKKSGARFLLSAHDDMARAATEITLLAADHPGLFARAAGALAVARLSVMDARIFTARDGTAFDTFWVQDAGGGALCDPKRIARVKRIFLDVMEGRVRPAQFLAARRAPHVTPFKITPSVRINNQASRARTLIEVEGLDLPGFLYNTANIFFREGLTLHAARIATFGERAVDSFLLTDATGAKIEDPARLKRIEKTLLKSFLLKKADASAAKTPRAKAPRAKAPRAKAPRAKVPRAKVPRAKAPRAKASSASLRASSDKGRVS